MERVFFFSGLGSCANSTNTNDKKNGGKKNRERKIKKKTPFQEKVSIKEEGKKRKQHRKLKHKSKNKNQTTHVQMREEAGTGE